MTRGMVGWTFTLGPVHGLDKELSFGILEGLQELFVLLLQRPNELLLLVLLLL